MITDFHGKYKPTWLLPAGCTLKDKFFTDRPIVFLSGKVPFRIINHHSKKQKKLPGTLIPALPNISQNNPHSVFDHTLDCRLIPSQNSLASKQEFS